MNILHLVGERIYVVRSQLEQIHRKVWKHEEKLNLFKNELTNLSQELDQDGRKITELKYAEASSRVLQAPEAAIEEYMRSLTES